ncbi:MAG: YhcH/YjgK/YiaL family protein [Prevotella sp.]|nr:YhcH/YjgK/YiaL family protein [Prevotella sp.]
MIIDTLDHLGQYVCLNPLFQVVADFLRDNDLSALSEGKHVIQGDDVFVNVQVPKGKTPEEAVLETHVRMIDIQVPISSDEVFGFSPACELSGAAYDETKDMTLFPGIAPQSYVTCKRGMFVVFFPQDGHAPCISTEPQFKKAIFKVAVR